MKNKYFILSVVSLIMVVSLFQPYFDMVFDVERIRGGTSNVAEAGIIPVPTCTSHYYKGCYNNDLYWYNSCSQIEEKASECGTSAWTNDYACSGNYLQRKWINRGCSGSSCYITSEWKTYQNCASYGKICQNGACVTPAPTCTSECSYSGQKRCYNGGYQVCGNYDSYSCLEWSSTQSCGQDRCIGTTYRNYYCSGSGNCTYSDNTCSSSCYSCGDGTCNSNCGENTSNCAQDCGHPTLNVYCYASPNPADINETVTFTAYPSGGSGSYSYSWSGYASGNNKSYSRSFSSSGTYTAYVTVTSNSQSDTASCSVYVSQPACQCGSWSSWQNVGCGSGSCSNTQMKQVRTRNCSPSGCSTETEYRCISYSSCYPTCTDECSYSGQTRCYNSNSRQICGNYDSDSCLEWSSVETCTGSTGCGYGSCSSNQRPEWYCSNGTCAYRCNYDSSCEPSYEQLRCYDNDLYWYDSYGNRLGLYRDCGYDYCDSWASSYCSGNNSIYQQRTCYHKGCSNNACYSSSYTETRLVQNCGSNQSCSNGQCISQCECTSGPCCDGCHYKSNSTICDVELDIQYGCPWGTGCGADVGERSRSKFHYCSGNSSTCSGNWKFGDWTSWTVNDYCSSNEYCSVGKNTCNYSANCGGPFYYKHYTKKCYNNDLYWYDSNGLRQDLYKECSDDNSCTIDSCQNNACLNETKCDGTTCLIGSDDYCESCSHCGDGICNCDETICSCSEDCKATGLSISVLGKTKDESAEWKEEFSAEPKEEIDLLLIVANTGQEELDDIVVEIDLPSEIDYKGELKMEGKPVSGDIEDGVEIGDMSANSIKTITFRGKIADDEDIPSDKEDLNLIGTVTSENLSNSDSVTVLIEGRGLDLSRLGFAGLANALKGWLVWLAVILILVALFILSFIYFLFWLIKKRRRKELLLAQQISA